MKDRWGTDITVGAVITYPNRAGAGLWIMDALVKEVRPDEITVLVPSSTYVFDADTREGSYMKTLRQTVVKVLDRVTVLPHLSAVSFRERYGKRELVTA
jgi:hypothetical protein